MGIQAVEIASEESGGYEVTCDKCAVFGREPAKARTPKVDPTPEDLPSGWRVGRCDVSSELRYLYTDNPQSERLYHCPHCSVTADPKGVALITDILQEYGKYFRELSGEEDT